MEQKITIKKIVSFRHHYSPEPESLDGKYDFQPMNGDRFFCSYLRILKQSPYHKL
jgi:hypothetical protein